MSSGTDVGRAGEEPATVAEGEPSRLSRVRAGALRRVEPARRRFEGSAAEHVWHRLDSMDFINRGLLFAAVLLLCFVPFLIAVASLEGRSTADAIVRHFGLDHQAADDVNKVFTSPSTTSGSITGISLVLVILSGVAAAAAVQELYEKAFGLTTRGMRDTWRRVLWLGAVVVGLTLSGWLGPWLHRVGSAALLIAVGLVAFSAFWWFSMWFLLSGRRSWSELLPSAVATGVCWLGMSIAFRLTMSNTITQDYAKYGPIGVVFAIMSFLVAIGVVIIIGAIVGMVWHERRLRSPTDGAGEAAATA